MELLLVVVIVGITAGVTMPSLVESIRWHRVRTASRTLVTVARYSRSMAILKQCDLALSFNLDTGQVDMIASNTTLPRFTRILDGVALEYVEVEGGNPVTEGACTVPYRRNGTCRPFAVKVRDSHGNFILVKVDALSSVRTLESGKQ
ncbi:MAG: hypothetical protein KKE37_02900 [Verrucomicrobia bacterium]|nr:hypothetical protein [Verrucomicrobiota bacterium]MBU4292265.1 hypothetical protein [Verrucomicrobiota bacterium]MBU4428285.1 hypothetical protein [Verrucomicrobiota bacterium]